MSGTLSEQSAPVLRRVAIVNQRGLHARAAARFVKEAAKFKDASIIVSKDGASVPGLSIVGLMMLAAGLGSSIEIQGTGREAKEAVDALVELVSNRFGEES